MPTPAPRISAMRRSGIREIMELADQNADVMRLEAGEPDFPTPPHVVEAACAAAREGYTTYAPNKGLLEVRTEIASKLARENGIDVPPDNVLVTCGAVNALFECFTALLSPGDVVLLPDPGWPNYQMMADTVGARSAYYPLDPERSFLPDLEHLERLAANPSAKMLVVNSPSNPTGAVFPPSVLQALVDIAHRYDLCLVSDECYEHIVFEGEHVSPAALDHDGRVLSVFSMSKSYAMTGWRMGYVAGAGDLISHVAKVHEAAVACAPSIVQKAGQAALAGDQSPVRAMTDSYRERRDLVVDLLRAGGLLINEPQGAFYALADISRCGTDSYSIARRLVVEAGVSVAPGLTFGPAGATMVRLSLATEKERLRIGTSRLVEAVGNWATR